MSKKPKPEPTKQPSAWLDWNHEHNCYGIEWDLPDTIDGHYACLIPHPDPETGRAIAERILDAMQGVQQFQRDRYR